MAEHVIEEYIIPESPDIIPQGQFFVYVPEATYNNKGIASFSSNHFSVLNGLVAINHNYFTSLYAEYVEGITGDINRGLEEILAIQEALMGGVLYG